MRAESENDFLEWAHEFGIALDPEYPQSAVLRFEGLVRTSRFWDIPGEPERRSYFFVSLLEAAGTWQSCAVWRALGSWPDLPPGSALDGSDPLPLNYRVDARLLAGLGLPLGTGEVVWFRRDEADSLLALMFTTSVFGWSVGEDLYVVPDNGSCVMKVGHHGVVYVDLREPGDVHAWVALLGERGFCLPDEIPDATFKKPDWMV
jgi:hypothetical protein